MKEQFVTHEIALKLKELAAENAVKDYPHDIKHEIKINVINTINQIK